MVTIICCYTNENMFKEFVLNSLSKQNKEYKLIGIDNREGIYKSASSAYNAVLPSIDTEYCVFLHQDIAFDQCDFLEQVENFLRNNKNSIYGFCGMSNDGVVYSNLRYKQTDLYITAHQISKDTLCESVDECCFAISTRRLKLLGGFDEDICDGWHLYAVELSIRNYVKNGNCYISPLSIYHKADNIGGLETDNNFLRSMRRICLKYKDKKMIYAPCYICSTNLIDRELRLLRSYVKNEIKVWKQNITHYIHRK